MINDTQWCWLVGLAQINKIDTKKIICEAANETKLAGIRQTLTHLR